MTLLAIKIAQQISDDILSFCTEINGESPIIVPIKTEQDYQENFCCENVEKHIQKHGGEMLGGWYFQITLGVCISAIAHSIYKSPNGQLFDVTPFYDIENAMRGKFVLQENIVFLPDSKVVFTKDNIIPSKRYLLSNDQDTKDYVSILDREDKFIADLPSFGINELNVVQATEYEKIQKVKKSLEAKILSNKNTRKKVGRNDLCPCGSGKKYKHCCLYK